MGVVTVDDSFLFKNEVVGFATRIDYLLALFLKTSFACFLYHSASYIA